MKSDQIMKFKRDKRFVITAIVITLIVVAVTAVIAIAVKSIVDSSSAADKIEEFKLKQLELIEQTNSLEENQNKIKEIISMLQDQVDGMNSRIQGLTQSLKVFENVMPHFVLYVAHVAAKLSITREKLNEINFEWKHNRVSPKLLDLFNFTLPCTPHCDINYAQPGQCLHNEEKQKIELMFDVKTTEKNTSILTADPFTMHTIQNNTYLVVLDIPVRKRLSLMRGTTV